jgi:hypothetical protein
MAAQTPNAKEQPVNIVGSSTFGRYPKISGEKTYNLFESDGWLVPTGGFQLALVLIMTAAKGRGGFVSIRGNLMVVVINANVYSINMNLDPTFIGTLSTQAGPVFIDENLNGQIAIVDGVNIYIYNYLQGPFLTMQTGGVLSANLVPNYVTFHNDLFLIGNKPTTTNRLGAFWYAYQFATPTTIVQAVEGQFQLQTKPDYALAIKRIPGQAANVMVFGTAVCEVWTAVGTDKIYRKNTSVSIDYGCLSVDTIAASDNYLAWLAVNESNSPVIMIYSGQNAEQISTDGISYLMSTIQFPAQSTATFLREDGHLFYQLTFYNPIDNLTLRYDLGLKQFYHVTDEDLNYFPAVDVLYFKGNNYFISLNDGSLYQMSTDFTNYNYNIIGSTFVDFRLVKCIPRIRLAETIRSPRTQRFRANVFTLTIEQGNDNGPVFDESEVLLIAEDGTRLVDETGIQLVAEISGQPSNINPLFDAPAIDLSIAYDGSVTFSNDDRRYMNPVGYRKNIMQWNQLGEANEMTLKLRFWSLGRIVCGNAILDMY